MYQNSVHVSKLFYICLNQMARSILFLGCLSVCQSVLNIKLTNHILLTYATHILTMTLTLWPWMTHLGTWYVSNTSFLLMRCCRKFFEGVFIWCCLHIVSTYSSELSFVSQLSYYHLTEDGCTPVVTFIGWMLSFRAKKVRDILVSHILTPCLRFWCLTFWGPSFTLEYLTFWSPSLS